MKISKLFIAVLMVVSGVASVSSATVITSVTPVNAPAVPGVTFGAVNLNQVTNGNNAPDTGAASVNTVTLNVSVDNDYTFGTPFAWRFNFTDAQGGAADLSTEYFVTVNLTNNGGHPISPVEFNLLAPTFTLGGSNPVGGLDFDTPDLTPLPTSTYNGVGLHTPTRLVFGGLGGGGGEIYTGQSATFTFSIDLPDYSDLVSAGSFLLTMTVNPEPTSLALATMALASGAGMVIRRRRSKLKDLAAE